MNFVCLCLLFKSILFVRAMLFSQPVNPVVYQPVQQMQPIQTVPMQPLFQQPIQRVNTQTFTQPQVQRPNIQGSTTRRSLYPYVKLNYTGLLLAFTLSEGFLFYVLRGVVMYHVFSPVTSSLSNNKQNISKRSSNNNNIFHTHIQLEEKKINKNKKRFAFGPSRCAYQNKTKKMQRHPQFKNVIALLCLLWPVHSTMYSNTFTDHSMNTDSFQLNFSVIIPRILEAKKFDNNNNNKRSDLNRLLDQIPYCYLTPVYPMVMILKHVNADALYKKHAQDCIDLKSERQLKTSAIEIKRQKRQRVRKTESEKDREEKTNEHEQIRKHMAESLVFGLSEIEHFISHVDSPSNDITFFDIFNCIMKDASLHIDLAQYLVTHLFHPFLEIALSSTPANNKMNGNYIKQNVLFCFFFFFYVHLVHILILKGTTLVLKRLKEEINNLNSCAICLEEMDYKNYCRLSRCRHLYHFSCIREHLKFSGDNRCPLCRSRFEMIQARKIEDKTQKTVLELFQTNQLTENDEDDASDSNMSDILSRVERTNSLFSAINALQQRNILCQQCQHRIHISYANNRGERHGFINCALCDHFFHVRCVNPDLFIQCQECLMLSSRKFLF
ncbi:zinc finger (C3HC4-type RING finger) family protein [Reticulomyxa filosa]|uniref:Zinc finger (C3HC4-type RING finger) family protein n=1 Tax=Reticulomyxa filosa TaxID=46433 RepID=X6NNL1_RETFI|nr:zinc finger (C3HC4-type RING finger) family protein [Reticulomyxa filosa]|eukprot:ETO26957.1 zinc finger (C3HC4-type RING finger) family protein [Reticulomyxa filosa]